MNNYSRSLRKYALFGAASSPPEDRRPRLSRQTGLRPVEQPERLFALTGETPVFLTRTALGML